MRKAVAVALAAMVLLAVSIMLWGCESARLPVQAGMGPNPQIPPPQKALIPTVVVAPAKGWPEGKTPTPATGFTVQPFATGLEHPRWLHVLPNGDVLVAETNAPPRPGDQRKGIKAWFMKHFMKKAGAAVPSANRITLLRDADGDGKAETRTVFLQNLHSPFGMALIGNQFYVANTDAIVRFDYRDGATSLSGTGTRVAPLPGGDINHHWTKTILASRDGKHLYATSGSNSNVAERGMEVEENRAAILEVDLATGTSRLFASGLRNPVGLALNPDTGTLWTVVNERDELGSDLVPDYLTSVTDGGFYGWPYSYYGNHVDTRVKPPRPDLVAKAIVPDYAIGSHTGSLGLTFWRGGAVIGQHGSWNRRPRAGYRVIYVPFANGKPNGEAQEILTGFVDDDGNANGRPVGVVVDKSGAILVADDVGNAIWRLSGERVLQAQAPPSPAPRQ